MRLPVFVVVVSRLSFVVSLYQHSEGPATLWRVKQQQGFWELSRPDLALVVPRGLVPFACWSRSIPRSRSLLSYRDDSVLLSWQHSNPQGSAEVSAEACPPPQGGGGWKSRKLIWGLFMWFCKNHWSCAFLVFLVISAQNQWFSEITILAMTSPKVNNFLESEDVRPSKKEKVWFYLLLAKFTSVVTQLLFNPRWSLRLTQHKNKERKRLEKPGSKTGDKTLGTSRIHWPLKSSGRWK